MRSADCGLRISFLIPQSEFRIFPRGGSLPIGALDRGMRIAVWNAGVPPARFAFRTPHSAFDSMTPSHFLYNTKGFAR